MPKGLTLWLRQAAREWHMPGNAHQLSHGGIWHRGEIEGWSHCERAWLSATTVRTSVGKDYSKPNPFHFNGDLDSKMLCRVCFRKEIPLLKALHVGFETHLDEYSTRPKQKIR